MLAAGLGADLEGRVREAKILLIGAGGIGCELIKNLVLTGFCDIEVIDLDTIDVSNLNRQFLFRPRHVGQPKSVVAREMALRLRPAARIVAHHADIKRAEFGLTYFQRFTVVMSALDNVDARRHVNRLCLATNKPLVEAGTTGYLGQVFCVQKGETACYECFPKPTPKVYPICTIRSTPDKPVHTVVWAKECFKLLFGDRSASMLHEPLDGPDRSVFMGHVAAHPDPSSRAAVVRYCEEVLVALYTTEVQKQIDMDKYKGAKHAPEPIAAATIRALCAQVAGASDSVPPALSGPGWDRRVWTPEECIMQLVACVSDMWLDATARETIGRCDFDKDHRLAMLFVTAASNLRSHVFKIPQQSFYEAKGVAGNIIPAIATTNAIVAGLQIMETLKILRNQGQAEPRSLIDVCRYTYCLRHRTRKGQQLQPVRLEAPVPTCFVCSKTQLNVQLDAATWTLERFLDVVVKRRLGFSEPTIMLGNGEIWMEGEDADDLSINLPKTLVGLPEGGVRDGTVLCINDFAQDLEVNVAVHHRTDFDEKKEPEEFRMGAPEAADGPGGAEGGAEGGGGDDAAASAVEPMEEDGGASSRHGGPKKRRLEAVDSPEPAADTKRPRDEA